MARPPFWRNKAAKLLLALGVAAGVTLAGGCNANHHDTVTLPVSEIPAGSFRVQKFATLPMKDDEPTEAFVRENLLFVYTKRHVIFTLDRESLATKWVVQNEQVGTRVRPPVVLKDYVCFPTISALDVYDRNGKNHRTIPTRGLALRSGAVGFGTDVFFGGDAPGGGRVENIDLTGSQYQSASVKWELATRGGISSTPVVQQGLLYIGDDNGDVYAVNADTRAAVWALEEPGHEANVFATSGPIHADLKADEYGVYVASMDTQLYCLGRADGKIRWKYYAGVPLTHSPDVTPTSVYILVGGQGLVALDKTTGDPARKPRWVMKDGVRLLAEDEKYAYVHRKDGSIAAADLKTGAVKFVSKRHDYTAFATALKGNVVYAVTADGTVRAVTPVLQAGQVGEMALGDSVEFEAVAMGK